MKFSQYMYERPNISQVQELFNQAIKTFRDAETVDEQTEAIKQINQIRNTYSTMLKLCMIRHTINTRDEFYTKEQDFFDETQPQMQKLDAAYYKELVKSKFRSQLELKWGKQLFNLAETQLRTFSEDIIQLLQKENKLSSEYGKLLASSNIMFEGNEYTLAQLKPLTESSVREVRKSASQAYFGFFAANELELDRIFDELVKIRIEIVS